MTPDELEKQGFKFHHTALFRGYISRKTSGIVETYSGRFGNGYTVKTSNYNSTQYSYISYYIKEN